MSAPNSPMRPTGATRAVSPAQQLVDLVLNSHDPGYREAADRRQAAGGVLRWYDHPATAVGSLLIGFVLIVAYIHTNRAAPAAAKTHDSLVQRVHSAQDTADRLAARIAELNAQVNTVRGAGIGTGTLADRLAAAQLAAGQTAVTGPGLEVHLADPPVPKPGQDEDREGTTPIGATHLLTDADVRSVVNQLWADGAQAVSVNDIRITSTTSIRFAGEVVLVDFQSVTTPYVIRGIGAADELATGFAASAVAARYQTQSSALGIEFSFTERQKLTMPAGAPVSLRYAKGTTK